MSDLKVCKFGGSSLATAARFQQVREILLADPTRRVVVASAPGARYPEDDKVTDLFIRWHGGNALAGGLIFNRFAAIVSDLEIDFDLADAFSMIEQGMVTASLDWAKSRGEWLNAAILAHYLGWEFCDPTELIFFSDSGKLEADLTYGTIQSVIRSACYVIPGFYGMGHDDTIRTFSRGGSDITGAILAAALHASLYENWTDTNGLRRANPRVVNNPLGIPVLTYGELRELTYGGATVFHDEAVAPVMVAGIPTRIMNTGQPEHPGTLIVATRESDQYPVTGIASRKGFTSVTIREAFMNAKIGYVANILEAVREVGVPFDQFTTGIDTITLVFAAEVNRTQIQQFKRMLETRYAPDAIEVTEGLALLAVVGQGMSHTPNISGRAFSALGAASINITLISQTGGEMSIVIGVDERDIDNAVRAVYGAFFD